jgi:hypothetical protein
VHENDTPRNSQAARTQGAICLGPANNAQDGFYFMSLRSGEKITRYSWTLLPLPDGELDTPAIDPVDALTGVDDGLDAVLEPPSLITGVDEVTTVPMDELAAAPTAELGNDPDPDEPEPPLILAAEPALAPTPDPDPASGTHAGHWR